MNEGVICQPDPGTGSKKFDDGTNCLQPATQAQGPARCWNFSAAKDECQQPCEAILLSLEDCFCNEEGTVRTRAGLLKRFQSIFAGHCLQRTRLAATAEKWLVCLEETFVDDDSVSVQWATWHAQVARFLVSVDFVAWLGEDCADVEQCPAVYRDADVLLPWLEFPTRFVEPLQGVCRLGLSFVPDNSRLLDALVPELGFYTHRQCAQSPECLDFDRHANDLGSSRFAFVSCQGLLTTLALPVPVKAFRSLAAPLHSLRLLSDFIRGALLLWVRQVPACILLLKISCSVVEVVRKIAPVRKITKGGMLLANFNLEGVAPCFTVLI